MAPEKLLILGITQKEPDPGVEDNCLKQKLLRGFIRQPALKKNKK